MGGIGTSWPWWQSIYLWLKHSLHKHAWYATAFKFPAKMTQRAPAAPLWSAWRHQFPCRRPITRRDLQAISHQGALCLWIPSKWRKLKIIWRCTKTQNLVPHTDRLSQKMNPLSRISQGLAIFSCNFRYNFCQTQGRDVDQTKPQKSLVKLIVWLQFTPYLLMGLL